MKQEKQFFSKLGLSFFVGTLLIYAVQWGASFIINTMYPRWHENMNTTLIVSMLPMYLIGLPLLIIIITRIQAEGTIEKHKMSFGKIILAFFMCYAIVYISNLIGIFFTTIIGVIKGSPVQNVLTDIVMGVDSWVLLLFTVICAPIYEEWIFRKLLIDRTIKYGEGISVVLSGLMFGLFHGNLSQFVYAFSLGLFFAFIYVKTGKVRYSIVLHMAINFMGSILPMFFLKKLNVDQLMEIMEQVQTGSAEGIEALQAIAPALMLLFIYVLALLAIVATGAILLLVYRRKFRLVQGEVIIPKGQRFITVVGNLGMILFSGFWIIQMIRQLMY